LRLIALRLIALRLIALRLIAAPRCAHVRPGHRLALCSGQKASEFVLQRFRRGIAERKGRCVLMSTDEH
jgi:hypothetical protein